MSLRSLTASWRCLEPSCDATGTTDRGAEQHVATTPGHCTITTLRVRNSTSTEDPTP